MARLPEWLRVRRDAPIDVGTLALRFSAILFGGVAVYLVGFALFVLADAARADTAFEQALLGPIVVILLPVVAIGVFWFTLIAVGLWRMRDWAPWLGVLTCAFPAYAGVWALTEGDLLGGFSVLCVTYLFAAPPFLSAARAKLQ